MIRDELGELAYSAYVAEHDAGADAGWGMPRWTHLPERDQRAWAAASRAVAGRTTAVFEIEAISSPSGICGCEHHLMFHDIEERDTGLVCCVSGCRCGKEVVGDENAKDHSPTGS